MVITELFNTFLVNIVIGHEVVPFSRNAKSGISLMSIFKIKIANVTLTLS